MKRLFIILICAFLSLGAGARDFDGTNDDVALANESNFDNQTALSVCQWVNIDVMDGNWRTISSKRHSGVGTNFLFNFESTSFDLLQFGVGTSSTFYLSIATLSNVLSINTWAYLCGTVYESGANTLTELFVDCVSLDSDTHTLVDMANVQNNVQVAIGEIIKDGTEDFDGQVAHFQFWDKQISSQECFESMFKPGSVVDSLQAYVPLWGDSPETDLSGNGNTGTVSGAGTTSDGPPVMLGGGQN